MITTDFQAACRAAAAAARAVVLALRKGFGNASGALRRISGRCSATHEGTGSARAAVPCTGGRLKGTNS